MTSRVLRAVKIAAAAGIAVTVLAGCQTKVGQAAVVNGARLSDTGLSKYVTKQAAPFTVQTDRIVPKVFALESWVDMTLFEQAIAQHGGPITSAERTQYQGLALNGTSPDQYAQTFTSRGFTRAMSDLRIQEQADFLLLAHRLHPKLDSTQIQQGVQSTLGTEAIAQVAKLAKHVEISRRYGSWDPKKIGVTAATTAGLPGFVTFGSGAADGANQ